MIELKKKLIDANEFNHSPAFLCGGFHGDPYYDGYCDALDRIQEVLEQQPTVDAVEVIRCKDCKHSKQPGNTAIRCGLPGTLTCVNPDSPCHYRHVLGDGYCPYGGKKEHD